MAKEIIIKEGKKYVVTVDGFIYEYDLWLLLNEEK